MKYIKLLLALALTIAIFYAMNTKIGSAPPIGKFLNPYTGIWQNETDEMITGEINIPSLLDEVSVHYDEQLIPHVFAQNETDLYKAQGYLTAKHRLWQLEFQTHAAAGRLSEIFGENALNYDRQERRKGMGYGADQAMIEMQKNPKTYQLVKAYADGVNAYIDQLSPKDYPVEYKLLDYQPEAWTPKKTALLLMYMTKMLTMRNYDLEYTNMYRILGQENFDLLFPDFFNKVEPIIPKDTDWSFIDVPQTPLPKSKMVLDTITETLDMPHPDNGSNNWAVSGAKSYSENPILANDPHLGLNLPSIWYVMQLSTPEHNVFGATIPGALGVISGFNEHIAWGETNATRDVMDWYKIEFNEDRTKYKYDGDWKDVNVRVEDIKIRGKENYKDSVLYTHHGPVVYDKNFGHKEELSGYALRWIGHVGGNNQRTFIDLNKAKNYDEYVSAISYWNAPAQNFVFASTEGDIALWVQGKFANKWEGQGKFLMDGSVSENDWDSYIPQQYNAHTKNPERGFVSSANQHPVDSLYPYFVFNDGYQAYRNRVINSVLSEKEKLTVQDFKDLHNNNFNLKASEIVPFMIKNINESDLNEDVKEVFDKIKSWNFQNDIDEVGPSIFRAWWASLSKMTWDEFESIPDSSAVKRPFTYQAIHLLKEYGNHELMDIKDTPQVETAKDLFLLSFKDAVKSLNLWKEENKKDYTWKDYKRTYAGHLLQALPAFSKFDIPIGGDADIVNATSENHGASWRLIVEMSSPPKAIGIYPGGQSGNPGSKYYDNFISDWAAGDYFDLNFMQSDQPTEAVIGTLTLKPSEHE